MQGFSLLEIMVTVAIIAIMASTVVIGFGSFEKTVRTQETAGVISDTIKNLELEMIRRDFVKQTVNFEANYLVIEAEVENQTLDLKWNREGSCGDDEELEITNPSGLPVYLAQRDKYGNNMQIDAITTTSDTVCVDFLGSDETEWRYQLFSGSDRSQTIRFVHFNIKRDGNPDNPAIQPNSYTLKITAPYGSKEFYNSGSLITNPVALLVQNGGNPVTLTLQE